MTYRADDPKFNFQCMSHLHGPNCEYFAGKAQLLSKDCLWRSLQQPSMSPYLQWWAEQTRMLAWKMVVVEVEPTAEHWQAGSWRSLRIMYAFPLLTNPQAPPHSKIIIYFVANFLSNILCKEMKFFFFVPISPIFVCPGQRKSCNKLKVLKQQGTVSPDPGQTYYSSWLWITTPCYLDISVTVQSS